jgi:hypothetical protein
VDRVCGGPERRTKFRAKSSDTGIGPTMGRYLTGTTLCRNSWPRSGRVYS